MMTFSSQHDSLINQTFIFEPQTIDIDKKSFQFFFLMARSQEKIIKKMHTKIPTTISDKNKNKINFMVCPIWLSVFAYFSITDQNWVKELRLAWL